MPVQQTFSLVPVTLANTNVTRPPMTLKAAKKAYAKANQQPRVSRAEQRRRDAEELAQQKKDFEREKNVAKAKAAREKKAAKENAARGERKKAGLPEPSRFVRASQPMISRFVRAAGGKRRWSDMEVKAEAEGEDSEGTITNDELPAKKVARIEEVEEEENDEDLVEEEQTAAGEVADDKQVRPEQDTMEVDSEDEFGHFPSLSQTDLLDRIDRSLLQAQQLQKEVTSPSRSNSPSQKSPILSRQSQDYDHEDENIDEYYIAELENLLDLVNTQLLSEAAEAAQRSDAAEQLITPKQATKSDSCDNPAITYGTLQSCSKSMPPPSKSYKRQITFAHDLPKPSHVPRPATSYSSSTNPPSATQAFLEANIEEFFPSPTQAVHELLDDIDDYDLPSNTQVALELGPSKPYQPAVQSTISPVYEKEEEDDYFAGLFCTQDFTLSSQELEDIKAPSRLANITAVDSIPEVPAPAPLDERLITQETIHNQSLLSSPKSAMPIVTAAPMAGARQRSKARFFEEKDDDLLIAALHESRKDATKPTIPLPRPAHPAARSSILPQLPSAPRPQPPRGRFFIEKEEDVLQYAIHESELLAKREAEARRRAHMVMPGPKNNQAVVPTRDVQAQTSSSVAVAGLGIASESDYGDDDFCGCSQELLAL